MPNLESIRKRNFAIHCAEGGLYMGGLAFLSAESVLPSMVHSLGGSEWFVALMPSLLAIGFFAPAVFVVPLLDRVRRYKPVVMWGGLAQRIPYLFAALAIFLFAEARPNLMLAIVIVSPLVSGLVGGLTVNAWLEMVTRMVPPKKRASGWAYRFIIQGVIGIAAGPIIHHILESRPGPPGYALLHLICFAFVMLSLVALMPMVEHDFPQPVGPKERDYFRQLLDIPRQAVQVPEFIRYLRVRFTGVGFALLAPFMAIHALAISGRPEEDVGYFVTSQMLGGIFGNILAARIGDRHGGKVVLVASRLLLIAISVFVCVNTSYAGFVTAFFAFGFAFFMERVGDLTMGVEICPRENRQSFLALLSFILMPAMILASIAAAAIQRWSGNFHHAALATGLLSVVSLIFLLRIREPRKTPLPEVHL